MYSSIKIQGKKLYEYARNGEEVTIPVRNIEIFSVSLVAFKDNTITFKALCSKGTYIRSLCVDIAKALGYPGHMSALERTKSGVFDLERSYTLGQIEQGQYIMLNIEEALLAYPKYIIADEIIVYHGKQIPHDTQEMVVVYNTQGKALAMYGPAKEGYLKNVRGLW
jgi:tRNA pseudouridine55 synthase